MAEEVSANGSVAPGFEAVRDAFLQNFTDDGDIGASFAVMRGGEVVADLWGGHTDKARTRKWKENTLVNVWSTTKGPTSLAVAMLVDRGELSYDDRVAEYWPDFASRGKASVTVAQMMSHQAGVCGVRDTITIDAFYDWDSMCRRLAGTEPFWEPGDGSGYHAVTFGFLAGELVRRIDGRTVGTFLREEVAGPLEADFFIGLPEKEDSRVAEMVGPKTPQLVLNEDSPDYTVAAFGNPRPSPDDPNDRAWRAAEIPAANGQANARGLVRIYNLLARVGIPGEAEVISAKGLAAATAEQCHCVDRNLGIDTRWGAGFMLNLSGLYGPNPKAFGHSGWGGSMAFADRESGLAVAYAMNQMGESLRGDPRSQRLIEAVYSSL